MLDLRSCPLSRVFLPGLASVGLIAVVPNDVSAQNGVGILPPVVSARDVNGVDLIGGSLDVPMSTLAAGSNGSGISRTGLGYNPITDNLSGTITAGFYSGDKYNGMVNVSVNGTSEWFYFPQWTTADNTSFIDGYGISEQSGYDCQAQQAGPSPDGTGFGYDQYYTHCFLPVQGDNRATTLNCTGSTCTFVMRDGSVATFLRTHMGPRMLGLQGNYGRITKLVKPDGEVLEYSYWHLYITQSGYQFSINMNALSPLQVTSSLGWTVRYQYQTSFGPPPPEKIAIVNATLDYCDPTANRCAAADQVTSPYLTGQGFYPNSGQVIDVTAGNTSPWQTWYVSGYSSPAGGNVSTTLYPNHTGTNAFWYWDNDTKVKTLTRNGKTWSYAYSPISGGISTTTVTNPDNTKRYLKFFGEPRPSSYRSVPVESVVDELGRTTGYVFARPPYIRRVISPEATYSGTTLTGGYTQYDYDSRWNPTQSRTYPKGGGTPITTSAVYPATCTNRVTCNKPSSVTDANLNTTTFTYDPVHGGILTETGPAVNGVQPQKRYSYSQITPRLKSATGSLVAQPPVWRLTGTSVCRTLTLATCVGTSDEIKTVISYGSDNTNPVYKNVLPVSMTTVAGDGSNSTTVAYTYDNFGHVTSVDGPRTDVDDTQYTTYDLYGRPLLQIGVDPDGSGALRRQATRTSYDPEGRVLKVEAGTTNTTTGSDFTAASYVLNSYDTTSGLLSKAQTVVLP